MVPSKTLDTLTMLGKKCKTSRKPKLKDFVWKNCSGGFFSFYCIFVSTQIFIKDEHVQNIKTNVFKCDKYGPPFKFKTTQAATPRLHVNF